MVIKIAYFLGAVWQEPNRLGGTELIPSTRFPPDDGIPGLGSF
jgi:hypothetical protein